MIGFERYCLSDKVTRTVDGENLTFSGYTMSDKSFSITVKLSATNEWINGGYMQQCFPHLTSEQREILLSGNDDESWNNMFPSEDEE
jgi:hypothetical protein